MPNIRARKKKMHTITSLFNYIKARLYDRFLKAQPQKQEQILLESLEENR